MKLYKSYIRPIIEHGSIAFISASKNQMERLQMIENNAIKTCLRLPRYIRDSLLHEYASLELLSVRLIRFNKKLLNIMKSSNEHIQALITDHVPANLGILSPLDVIEEMRQFWKVSCSGSTEPAAWSATQVFCHHLMLLKKCGNSEKVSCSGSTEPAAWSSTQVFCHHLMSLKKCGNSEKSAAVVPMNQQPDQKQQQRISSHYTTTTPATISDQQQWNCKQ